MKASDYVSDEQRRTLALLTIAPGLLSAMGSLTIIYFILKKRRKITAYRRIMLIMSSCDFVWSLVLIFQPFLLPEETSHQPLAMGNDSTCQALGFITQFSFIIVWYNGMLSVYFLFLAKFQVEDKVFARVYEPYLHLLCIGYPLVTAVYGSVKGLYDVLHVGDGCWYDHSGTRLFGRFFLFF